MTIRIGERVPAATFNTMTAEGPRPLTSQEVFGGRLVALFAVPGAFTPACSDVHLPGYQVRAPELRAAGVDTIACVAVNDAFVLDAWAKARGVGDDILMLADGNGDFARAVGLELDGTGFGMGRRSQRYAALVDDGVVRWLGVEPGRGVTVSGAEAVLAALGEPVRKPG